MRLSTKPVSLIVSLLVGGVIGCLRGSAIVLVPWAFMGIFIGILSNSRKAAVINGAVYGFALAYVFMIVEYNGKESVSTKLMPFIVFGIVGAICAIVLALVSYLAKQSLEKQKQTD